MHAPLPRRRPERPGRHELGLSGPGRGSHDSVVMSSFPARDVGVTMPAVHAAVGCISSRLFAPWIAPQLTRPCPVGPGDLVLDLGAGQGAITASVAATGARGHRRGVPRPTPSPVRRTPRRPGGTRRLPRVPLVPEGIHGHRQRSQGIHGHRQHSLLAFNAPVPTAVRLRADRAGRGRGDRRMGFARPPRAIPHRLEAAWWAARFDVRLRSRVPAPCFRRPHESIPRTSPSSGRTSTASPKVHCG